MAVQAGANTLTYFTTCLPTYLLTLLSYLVTYLPTDFLQESLAYPHIFFFKGRSKVKKKNEDQRRRLVRKLAPTLEKPNDPTENSFLRI